MKHRTTAISLCPDYVMFTIRTCGLFDSCCLLHHSIRSQLIFNSSHHFPAPCSRFPKYLKIYFMISALKYSVTRPVVQKTPKIHHHQGADISFPYRECSAPCFCRNRSQGKNLPASTLSSPIRMFWVNASNYFTSTDAAQPTVFLQ